MQEKNRTNNHITGSPKVYGIIGDPVSHSLSPAIWNAAFQSTDQQALYVPFRVESGYLSDAVKGLAALNARGVNVTMPHKHDSARLCEFLHSPADELKNVNTLKFFNQNIEGYNTDATGFLNLLKQLKTPKKALVLGNGSASKSVIWALDHFKNVKVTLIARKPGKRPDFLSPDTIFINLAWNGPNLIEQISANDMIINATPLGMCGGDQLEELYALDENKTYIDLNYNAGSALLEIASKKAGKLIDGRELLLAQACESYKILTGLEPPEKIMRSCIF